MSAVALAQSRALRGERLSGVLFARAGTGAGLAAVGLSVAGAVLVPARLWEPVVVWPVVLVVLAVSWRLATALPSRPVPVWPAAVTLAECVGFAVWAGATHAEHVVVRRDPGAYALYTQWIATHHGLPIPGDLAAFGGAAAQSVAGFTLDSPAFYEVGAGTGVHVVPQFLVGSPAAFSLGWWLGGPFGSPWTGMQVVPAVLGGLALLAFAGLAARLVGPRWAPLAVAALGLAFPVLHAARSTYSEPQALLVLLAGACLAVDALAADDGRRLGWLAGLVLGLAGLVRVDAVREVALLVACCAVLALARHRAAVPLGAGAVLGTLASVGVWFLMARPYLVTVESSLRPLLLATGAVVLAAALVVPPARRAEPRWRPALRSVAARGPALGLAVTAVVALLGLYLAARPLFSVVRQDPNDPGSLFVATLQGAQGLRIDGGRTYAEQSMTWVSWYSGWPALAVAWAVMAVAAGRAVAWAAAGRRVAPWAVPAAVALGSAVLVLYRPGITPDHPWADRRLVPTVFPLVALAATAAAARLVRLARRRAPAWLLVTAALAAAAVILVPPLAATAPLAGQRTEVGEPAAVAQVCATFAPQDVVVAVDATPDGTGQRSANEWVQVVRGVCGRPSAALLTPAAQLPQAVGQLASLTAGAGHRLVLLTAQEDDADAQRVLSGAVGGATTDGPPQRAVGLVTVEDRKLLTRRPPNGASLVVDVWTVRVHG